MSEFINSPPKKVSLFQQYITINIVIFVFVALTTTIMSTSYFFIEHNKQLNNKIITQFAKITASISIPFIINSDHKSLTKRLSVLDVVSNINYIHIYKTDLITKSPSFFASYNNNDNFPAIPDQIHKKDLLLIPTEMLQGSELILPIKDQGNIIGYVYIQINDNHLSQLKTQITLIVGSLTVLFILLSFLISSRISSRLKQSFEGILSTVQQSAHDKDFSLTCPTAEFKEIDLLVRNINILLTRTHKHFLKLSENIELNKKVTLDLENKVTKRTNALKESNQELLSTLEKLHQFQNQLVENEKMASLGDMVAGIAHEVNTPIGLGVTASSLLSDRINEIKQAFDNKTLKSSDLKKFIKDGQENISIIYRNLKRSADLISSFKKVAVDQSNVDIRSFNVNELINEIIMALGPKIYNTPYKLNIQCPNDLVVQSKPGPINQILINLILNSIIHGFETRDTGTITISVMVVSHQLHIQYEDDGMGIDKSVIDKIFEPFTTTKRGKGGSGLGLHLVYNLVTQALGGNIYLDDKCDNGVNFNIYFPVTFNKQTK